MRIRVGVRVRVPADGCSREEEVDKGFFLSVPWSMHKDNVQTSLNRQSDAAVAADVLAGTTVVRTHKCVPSKAPATERPKTGSGEATAGEGNRQKRQNGWQTVTDFWYFADARHVPTIGSLKQQLLLGLLCGELPIPSAAGALVADLARSSIHPHHHGPALPMQCSGPNLSDSRCSYFQHFLCRKAAPTVVLRLKGALLPDDQPLQLLENEDHVDLCFSSESVMPPAVSDISRAFYGGVACSCPHLLRSAPSVDSSLNPVHASGAVIASCHDKYCFLFQKGGAVCPCCSGVHACGCGGHTRFSRSKLMEDETVIGEDETREKIAARSLQKHPSKRRRLQEIRARVSRTTLAACGQYDTVNEGAPAQLPAVAPGVLVSHKTPAIRKKRILSAAASAKKKARQVAPSNQRKVPPQENTLTTGSMIERSKSQQSSTASNSNASGHGQCNNIKGRSLGEEGKGIGKDSLKALYSEGRSVPVTVTRASSGMKNQKALPLSSDTASAGKTGGGGSHGAAAARTHKERHRWAGCNKKRMMHNGITTATTVSVTRDRSGGAAASGGPRPAAPSVTFEKKVSPGEVSEQRSSVTTAGHRPDNVSIHKNTVEKRKKEEESSSDEEEADEESSNRDNCVRGSMVPARETKGKAVFRPSDTSATTKTHQATRVGACQKQQTQQASVKSVVVEEDDDSTDDSSSSDESTSSSSDDGEEDPSFSRQSGSSRSVVCELRGRMPAAVARAAAALGAKLPSGMKDVQQQEERRVDLRRDRKTASECGAPSVVEEYTEKDSLAQRPLQSARPGHTTGSANSKNRLLSDTGGARKVTEVLSSAQWQSVHAREKSFSRQPPRQERSQQQEWQQQAPRQQQKPQQERQQQVQRVQESDQERTTRSSGQALVFKLWKDPSLVTVQRGDWLRVRILQLVRGMPTLDETWRTVFVEAIDKAAGRIKLWELRQRGTAEAARMKYAGSGNRSSNSNSYSNHIKNTEGPTQGSEDGECRVHVPFRKPGMANQKGGGGKWYDWSTLACISRGVTPEISRNNTETTASRVNTSVAAADAELISGPNAATSSAVMTTSSDAGGAAVHARSPSSMDRLKTVLDGAAAGTVTQSTTIAKHLPGEMVQRTSAPLLRYLPRRLLSLPHLQTVVDVDSATEREAAVTAAAPPRVAVTESEARHSSTQVTTLSDFSENCVDLKSSSVLCSALLQEKSNTTFSQNNRDTTSSAEENPNKSIAAESTTLPKALQKENAQLSDAYTSQQETGQISEDSATTGGAITALLGDARVDTPREQRLETASQQCDAEVSELHPAKAGAKSRSSSLKGRNNGVFKVVDDVDTTTDPRSMSGHVSTDVSIGGRAAEDSEKTQWEALVIERLELYFDEDEEAVLASHPAAPLAAFHLPLPRELVHECSRRLEAVLRRNRMKSSKGEEQRSDPASARICGSDTQSTTPSAATSGSCADATDMQSLDDHEKRDTSQQVQVVEGATSKYNASSGENIVETPIGEQNFKSNGKVKRILPTEAWKEFDCVKVCARRVVGEQLQQIRRALRRQVDYYFSPGNWQKDVYLRSRAVAWDPGNNNSGSDRRATSFEENNISKTISTCCADGNASTTAQEVTEGTEGVTLKAGSCSDMVSGEGRHVAANTRSLYEINNHTTEKEMAGPGMVAVNLDDIMAFPRMQGLSKDKNFVAWCITCSGGLHHVKLEKQGETYWLIRNAAAGEVLLDHKNDRKTKKAAGQQ